MQSNPKSEIYAGYALSFSFFLVKFVFIRIQGMIWEISPWVMPHTIFRPSWHSFWNFLELLFLLPADSEGPPCLNVSSMEENFLFFLGTLVSDSSGSLTGSSLGKDFFFFGKTSTASCVFKIATNQLLLGKRFLLLGFGKRDRSFIPFSRGVSCFFFIGVLASWEAAEPREPECVPASSLGSLRSLQGPSTSPYAPSPHSCWEDSCSQLFPSSVSSPVSPAS